jgi:hypothetical protein
LRTVEFSKMKGFKIIAHYSCKLEKKAKRTIYK